MGGISSDKGGVAYNGAVDVGVGERPAGNGGVDNGAVCNGAVGDRPADGAAVERPAVKHAGGDGAVGDRPADVRVVGEHGGLFEVVVVLGKVDGDQLGGILDQRIRSRRYACDGPALRDCVVAVLPAHRGCRISRQAACCRLSVLDKGGVFVPLRPRRRDLQELLVVHDCIGIVPRHWGAVKLFEAGYIDQPHGVGLYAVPFQCQRVRRRAVARYRGNGHPRVVIGRHCRGPVVQRDSKVERLVQHVGPRGCVPEARVVRQHAVAASRNNGAVVVRHGDLVGAGELCRDQMRQAGKGAVVSEGYQLVVQDVAEIVRHAVGIKKPASVSSRIQRDRAARLVKGQHVRDSSAAADFHHGAASIVE